MQILCSTNFDIAKNEKLTFSSSQNDAYLKQ